MNPASNLFDLSGKVTVITGGAGVLGLQHAQAIMSHGGTPVLLDINTEGLIRNAKALSDLFQKEVLNFECDITSTRTVIEVKDKILKNYRNIDILINNAARNPKVEAATGVEFSRLEEFDDEQWNLDLSVGLGGAFICSKVFGTVMACSGEGGVITNIASDLSVIAPDQRLYSVAGLPSDRQPVKPVTYSVVKHGLIGLTKYLSTYWCDQGVRCNALSPGGIYNNQNDIFISKINKLIPMGRMANPSEYQGAIIFLCSNASSYLNGANLIMDGGRSVW